MSFTENAARRPLGCQAVYAGSECLIRPRSDWGVRKVASPAATSPLTLTRFDAGGAPVFNFTGPSETFVDDPSVLSRWQIQVGLRYLLN